MLRERAERRDASWIGREDVGGLWRVEQCDERNGWIGARIKHGTAAKAAALIDEPAQQGRLSRVVGRQTIAGRHREETRGLQLRSSGRAEDDPGQHPNLALPRVRKYGGRWRPEHRLQLVAPVATGEPEQIAASVVSNVETDAVRRMDDAKDKPGDEVVMGARLGMGAVWKVERGGDRGVVDAGAFGRAEQGGAHGGVAASTTHARGPKREVGGVPE